LDQLRVHPVEIDPVLHAERPHHERAHLELLAAE
jgi:hypothetical protein